MRVPCTGKARLCAMCTGQFQRGAPRRSPAVRDRPHLPWARCRRRRSAAPPRRRSCEAQPRARGNYESSLLSGLRAGSRTSEVVGGLSLSHFNVFRTRPWPIASSFAQWRCGAAGGAPGDSSGSRLLLPVQEPQAGAVGQALTGGFGDGRSCPELINEPAFCRRPG